MARRKWTITTHVTGRERQVELVVYDTLGIMRREATRWARRHTPDSIDFHDAEGVCHGFDLIRIHADGSETPHPLAVVVRLATTRLSPLIVAHEFAHAAQHLYLLDYLGYDSAELATDHFDAGNEDFAHLYGELFGAAWDALDGAGLIGVQTSPNREG